MFVARVANAIAPFLATVLVPSPWRIPEIEVLRSRQMADTCHKRLPQRPIIRPFRKDFEDRRIVNGRFPMRVCRHWETLPLHPGVEHRQDQVEDAVIAQLALGDTPGHREVR
jgi:hypothetical protein